MLIKLYKKNLLLALLIVFGIAGYSSIIVNNAFAQDNVYPGSGDEEEVYYDPADYQQWKDNFKETPVENMAFLKNKEGCAQKMAFTTVLIKKFKSGDGIDDIASSPILGPYMREQYDQIREKGVAQVQKDMLKDYQECIKTADVEEDAGDEYDLDMHYGACDKLNTILMDTVDSIKKRQNLDTVLRRYENKSPDLSETSYGELEDAVPMLISKLYQDASNKDGKSQQEIIDSLYERASQLVLACTL